MPDGAFAPKEAKVVGRIVIVDRAKRTDTGSRQRYVHRTAWHMAAMTDHKGVLVTLNYPEEIRTHALKSPHFLMRAFYFEIL